MYTDYNNLYSSYLSHSGKKGMKWGIRKTKKIEAAKKYWNKVTNDEAQININPKGVLKRMNNDWKKNSVQITKEINSRDRTIKASIISGMSIVSGIALSYVGSLADSSRTMAIGAAIATGSTGVYAIANHKLNNDKFVKRIKNHRESAHNEEYKKLNATQRESADKVMESINALDKYRF